MCTYHQQVSFLHLYKILRFTLPIMVVPFGLVVRIPGFHPGGLGSIPGMGTSFPFLNTTELKVFAKEIV